MFLTFFLLFLLILCVCVCVFFYLSCVCVSMGSAPEIKLMMITLCDATTLQCYMHHLPMHTRLEFYESQTLRHVLL